MTSAESIRSASSLLASLLGCLALACSGSSNSSVFPDGTFAVLNISIPQGEQNWRINRAVDITFNEDVDFDTVGLNTIRIADPSGRPATGSFTQPLRSDGSVDRRLVRFQPACPTLADNSDAGFLPGGVSYSLVVAGSQQGGVTVRSTAGAPLANSRTVLFRTPASTLSSDLFIDTVAGPPGVRLRGQGVVGADDPDATYLELGADPDNRLYFELDAATQTGQLPAGFELPLNKYGEPETRVAVYVYVNQPVEPSALNFSRERVRLEYRDPRNIGGPGPEWVTVPAAARLDANCTETGAVVRLEPRGVLPQGADMRVTLGQGFSDLTGDALDAPRSQFARMTSRVAFHPTAMDPTRDADDILEPFLVGGSAAESLQDTSVALAVPSADWGDGELRASFAFGGTGGSGGGFDWVVPGNVVVVVDTDLAQISGPSGSQSVVGGIVDVRNLSVGVGAQVIFQGTKPARIFATGTVNILGELSVRGSNSPGVGTLNTTNFPEPGGGGQAGGGNGGIASFLTSQSTPRGGPGFGAFNTTGGGGQGGEACFSPATAATGRRASGGGGGRLGPDLLYPYTDLGLGQTFEALCQTLIGMDSEPGFGGSPQGMSAVTLTMRAMGGAVGPVPFVDERDDNNFLGSMIVDPGEPTEQLVLGELERLWAGSGGGAGGDAIESDVFPPAVFTNGGDEKGAGGGGGAGGISIFAIGPILVGPVGRIVADGGHGGGGENTSGINRIGGGSGGGSGGHIVLSSANHISIAPAAVTDVGPLYNDTIGTITTTHAPRPISALGGQGGAGRGDDGGRGSMGTTRWQCDAIPVDRVELVVPGMSGFVEIPPRTNRCFMAGDPFAHADLNDPLGPVLGAGGDGGPGIIQLHVDNPALNLRFPELQSGDVMSGFTPAYGAGLDVTPSIAPPPLGWNGPDDAEQMVPFFGARSVAQSLWIPLGLGRLQPDPANPGDFLADDQVVLRFAGTDTSTGAVLTLAGGEVELEDPLLGPTPIGGAGVPPFVVAGSGGAEMVLDSSALAAANDVYRRSAALLRGAVVRLESATDTMDFSIEYAEHDEALERFRVRVDTSAGALDTFVANAGGAVDVSLIPHFFRVGTNSTLDVLPEEAEIRVIFDATVVDTSGNPDPSLAYSASLDGMGQPRGFTADITDLNSAPWDFVRFRVDFNLNTSGSGVDLSTPRPAVRFLRIPFEF